MHEMAIAQGVLDIALDYARRNEATRISCVSLRLGEMSGVETSSLEFCFAALTKGTIAESARLLFHRCPLVARCRSCGHEGPVLSGSFFCPDCGKGALEIISGREMQVEYLEVD